MDDDEVLGDVLEVDVPDVEVLEPDRLDSNVPVISTFSLTCLLSSLS
jgi:hypothetical protein